MPTSATTPSLNRGSGTVNGQPIGIVSAWPMMQADFYPRAGQV
ncbi:hypothetical protein [Micromonospora sp. NPDC050276]